MKIQRVSVIRPKLLENADLLTCLISRLNADEPFNTGIVKTVE